ncbi:hypothetical protein J6590_023354 [Homalodisca vitripennis]|nr:hypothetical protein J6590_023354 [Homalodisca vitripennis]
MPDGITWWGGCANVYYQRCFVLQKKAIRIISKIIIRESCDAEQRRSEYNTKGRDAFRSAQHRLQAYEALPLDLRVENSKPLFKRKLRRLLVQGAYYAVGLWLCFRSNRMFVMRMDNGHYPSHVTAEERIEYSSLCSSLFQSEQGSPGKTILPHI